MPNSGGGGHDSNLGPVSKGGVPPLLYSPRVRGVFSPFSRLSRSRGHQYAPFLTRTAWVVRRRIAASAIGDQFSI